MTIFPNNLLGITYIIKKMKERQYDEICVLLNTRKKKKVIKEKKKIIL